MTTEADVRNTLEKLSRIDPSQLPPDGGDAYNRLIFEKSPYLLQHAENPIDWHPWGEEAFTRARELDRPVLVSIGYSTCHWCHVMAHESFEDGEVADLLNRHFVAIKVDREERPDIDDTYMAVCQMMTGSGGWPLNLILSPDKEPFFAATYLPKRSRGGMSGLIPILAKVVELWQQDRERLLQTGEEIYRALRRIEQETVEERPLDEDLLRQAFRQYLESFDRQHAGFGSAPKFPAPHNLSLLLRLADRFGEEQARTMALQTLQALRMGGIYDQLGFGLHRYSVDARWLVPHFEKMLYDQALLALANVEAHQATGDTFFSQTAKEICRYVVRDLSAPEGGFCCGEDADSEGEEGTFYLWTPEQVKSILGDELGTIFCRSYNITEEGNFEGKSIPYLEEDLAGLARRAQVDADELSGLLAEGRRRLFEERQKRIRPHRDDKVLTAWNGLMIAALSKTAAATEAPEFLQAAGEAADFIQERLTRADGRLLRRFRAGEAAVPAFLEDYAFLVWGLLELHQAGFGTQRLSAALELADRAEELFGDGQGGYFDTGKDTQAPLTRGRSLQDGALPSGSSVMALNLLRLSDLTGDPALEERGLRLLRLSCRRAEAYPSAFSQMLIALDYALGPRQQVVFAPGAGGEAPPEMRRALHRRFLPRTQALLHAPGDAALESLTPLVLGKDPLDGRPAAYLCRDRTCRAPCTTSEDLEKLLFE